MERDFLKIIDKSKKIREKYHFLEEKYHGRKWTKQEDIIAYLSDSGLLARNFMSENNIWPKENSKEEFKHKLAENIWWLIVIAERNEIDISECLDEFFQKTKEKIGIEF